LAKKNKRQRESVHRFLVFYGSNAFPALGGALISVKKLCESSTKCAAPPLTVIGPILFIAREPSVTYPRRSITFDGKPEMSAALAAPLFTR
jgi:hypothetical protein